MRLARREIRRSAARSALVAAMVGVPVLLIMGAVILLRTIGDVSSEERALRTLGAADALVTAEGRTPVVQDFEGHTVPAPEDTADRGPANGSSGDDGSGDDGSGDDPAGGEGPWTASEVAEVTKARALPLRSGSTLITTEAGAISAKVREFDVRDPATDGLARILDGRAPRGTGEILVSEALVERGFGPGTTLRAGLDGGLELSVVGVVRNPAQFDGNQLVGLLGSVLGPDVERSYLLDTGGVSLTWSEVRELNRLGLGVASRAVLVDPPPQSVLPEDLRSPGGYDAGLELFYALVISCIVLQVVLLAGPAFAVGARRQGRQFALLVATGGTSRDVRRVMLAQGAVLGLGAGVLGIALAIGVLAAGRPLVEELVGAEIGPYAIRPLDMLFLVAVSTFAAFAAAWIPARQAARQDTVAALGGRGAARARRGWPLLGLLACGAGLLVALPAIGGIGNETQVVMGTFGLVAGMIMLTPAVLGLLGRLGSRLPLSLRLATRDAARHRARATSAVAAIMGTVLAITALSIGSSSDFAESRRDYTPQAPMGSLTVSLSSGVPTPETQIDTLVERVDGLLPDRDVALAYRLEDGSAHLRRPGCQEDKDARTSCGRYRSLPEGVYGPSLTGPAVLVTGPVGAEAVVGRLTKEQRRTLAGGGALIPDAGALDGAGVVRVGVSRGDGSEQTVTLPGAAVPAMMTIEGHIAYLVADLVVSPETAQRLDLNVQPTSILVPPRGPEITEEQEAQIAELVQGLAPNSSVYVERGFVESYTPILAILAGVGALVMLVGTGTATALSLDDARPDFATLAALGASARVRRAQAMAQAAVIGFVGAVLGVAAGAVPGIAITWPLTAPSPNGHILDVPWTLLGLLVLGVPLLAVLGAGLFTRSRLPMVRRLT